MLRAPCALGSVTGASGAFSLPPCGVGTRSPAAKHTLASRAWVLATKCFLGPMARAAFFFICVFSWYLKQIKKSHFNTLTQIAFT